MNIEKLVTANTIAGYVGENVQTVWRKAREGTYPSHKSGRLVRFKISEIDSATLVGGEVAKKDETRCRSNPALR